MENERSPCLEKADTFVVKIPTDLITTRSKDSCRMIDVGNMPCGAGYKRDCRKPICVMRHIDDPLKKVVQLSMKKNKPADCKIKTNKYDTRSNSYHKVHRKSV